MRTEGSWSVGDFFERFEVRRQDGMVHPHMHCIIISRHSIIIVRYHNSSPSRHFQKFRKRNPHGRTLRTRAGRKVVGILAEPYPEINQ